MNNALFTLDDANLQTLVLGSLENLVSVKAVESFCSILSGWKGVKKLAIAGRGTRH